MSSIYMSWKYARDISKWFIANDDDDDLDFVCVFARACVCVVDRIDIFDKLPRVCGACVKWFLKNKVLDEETNVECSKIRMIHSIIGHR